jgi:hypothetical protein
MRLPVIGLFVVMAALLGEMQTSNAQSAYSYPWCSVYGGGISGGGGAMSCYYTSWEQCMATMSGLGGPCVASPYYRAQATQLPAHSVTKPRHRRPAPRSAE